MKRKGCSIMVVGVLVLLAITFTRCSAAMSEIDSDTDLQMELVAAEVKEKVPKKNATKTEEKSTNTNASEACGHRCKNNDDCELSLRCLMDRSPCGFTCEIRPPIPPKPLKCKGKRCMDRCRIKGEKVKGICSQFGVCKSRAANLEVVGKFCNPCRKKKCGELCQVKGSKDGGRCAQNGFCNTRPGEWEEIEKTCKKDQTVDDDCFCKCKATKTVKRCKKECRAQINPCYDACTGSKKEKMKCKVKCRECKECKKNADCDCPKIPNRDGTMVGGGRGICNANGTCADKSCPMPGRPFTVEGKYRTTTSLIGNLDASNGKATWKIGQVPPTLSNDSINQVIAMEFSEQGEGEHASVASFARHTLQLMTMGAPSELLVSSQKASMDEIKHAKMCYGLAAAFFGSNVQPGRLDIDGSVKSSTKEDIIQSVINEGCIGETISAVRAQLGSHYAKQPMIKDALEQIAADESNHAQLAWNTVQWAIERYPELRCIAEETFRVQLNRPLASLNNIPMDHCDDCERDSALHDHGLLLDVDQDHTETFGIKNVIEPVVKHGFQNVDMISKQILNIDFMKY